MFLSTPLKHVGVILLQAFEHFGLVFNTTDMFKQKSTFIRSFCFNVAIRSHMGVIDQDPDPRDTDTQCHRYNPAIN